jgi:hypothetical protein
MSEGQSFRLAETPLYISGTSTALFITAGLGNEIRPR